MSLLPYSKWLESLYTFDTPYDDRVCGAIREGNMLWVPRESVAYAAPEADWRTSYDPAPVSTNFKPRNEEQGNLVAKSVALLQSGQSHLFEAPTGWGKTVVGGEIIARFGQPTLIVVNKGDLVDQWRDALIGVLGISPAMIGHIQADVDDWKGKQFVIGMVQSLIMEDKYPAEMFKYFGLMVLDEVHQMAADCFIRTCQKFTARYRLGFSATPTRKDGKTQLLHWHIGPIMVKGSIMEAKPKILVVKTGWKIPVRRELVGNDWQYTPIPHAPGRMMLVNKAMASSEGRNMTIVNFVKQSYEAERTTLILSDLREAHLDRLFQILTNEGIPGNDIGYYVGQMSKVELSHTKKRRVVLGTYKMCSTGTDVPHWDTLVMATPRAEIKQIIGRVMRAVAGKKQPVILDLLDGDPLFQSFFKSRLKQYYGLKAEVVRL
jgi:superfamily II DNA or RNA helicase